jgi:flagellar hook assembly protein FlgD
VPDGASRGVLYPNPTIGPAALVLSPGAEGPIQIEIYDVMGRRIRVIEHLGSPGGEQVVLWDGKDSMGAEVGQGVYLLRYVAGAERGERRLVKIGMP